MTHKKRPDPRETKMEGIRGPWVSGDLSDADTASDEPDGPSKDSDEPDDDRPTEAPQR